MRDSAQFDNFYATTSRSVVGQVYLMVGDLAEAEDAVQEAYARAWQRWTQVSSYADPAAWVRTVAYRIAVSSWRRARNRALAHTRWGRTAPEFHVDQDTTAVVEALRGISPGQRQVIVLHHLIGLSIRDIAVETGDSISAIKVRLMRGRRALAASLGAQMTEEVENNAQ